jgi:para-nitrobenzyl esterase
MSRNGKSEETSIHLTLFNLPATVTSLKLGMTDPPPGSTYGPNVHGRNAAYAGPHTHTPAPNDYHYQVLALDSALSLDKNATLDQLVAAMAGHVLASGDLIGVSAKDPEATDAEAQPGGSPIHIETGLLTGIRGRDASIMVYKGVPYAAPPVGNLRFRAPQPPTPWQGVHKAEHFGNICPASDGRPLNTMSEDCLFVNVWTKAGFGNDRRPVMVWFHGATFSGSSPDFDGEALARKGLVVVTFNRREGALGGLATPELSKESGHNSSGNYTLLDSIAVLQWVHKNIAVFGGDPDRVTIVGESAGAGQVDFLAISPLAKGLFIRAIAQSHVRYSRDPELLHLPTSYRTLKDAEAAGLKFQEAHNAHSVAELRALTWQDLLKGGGGGTVLDGWVVPKGYNDTYSSREQNSVPFIAGNDRDETGAVPEDTIAARRASGNTTASGMQGTNLTIATFNAAAKRKFGASENEFLNLYPASTDDEAALANNDTVRDNSRVSTFLWAKDWQSATGKPIYTYFWTYRHTNSPNGAYHSSEIQFIFNNLATDKTWTDQDHKVADTMSSYWANFVATGSPNGSGLPNWPAFDPDSPTVMELGEHFGPVAITTQEKLRFWERFFETQPPM